MRWMEEISFCWSNVIGRLRRLDGCDSREGKAGTMNFEFRADATTNVFTLLVGVIWRLPEGNKSFSVVFRR